MGGRWLGKDQLRRWLHSDSKVYGCLRARCPTTISPEDRRKCLQRKKLVRTPSYFGSVWSFPVQAGDVCGSCGNAKTARIGQRSSSMRVKNQTAGTESSIFLAEIYVV